jgi:hypothetical protein
LYSYFGDAELGYAVTDHVAQGRTVTAGLAVITVTEDRQHAYVALSRGTEVNMAHVFSASPKVADSVPGPRPAPELARYDRLATQARLGYSEREITQVSDRLVDGIVGHGDAAAIAAKVRRHLAAGADHVMVMPTATELSDGIGQLEQLAPTLAGLTS